MDDYTYKNKQVSIYDEMDDYYSMNSDKQIPCIDVATFNEVLSLYKDVSHSMHTHDFYLIIFFEEGEGTHNIDFVDYQIEKDMIFFLSPSQMHSLKNANNCKGYVVNFSKDFFTYMSNKIHLLLNEKFFVSQQELPSICILPSEASTIIKKMFATLYDTYAQKKTYIGFIDYMAANLTLLLLDILHYSSFSNQEDGIDSRMKNSTYLEYVYFVENNFNKIHSVKDCAKKLNISLSTLDRNVMKAKGVSASTLLNERIILEAKRILKYRLDLRIKEVASMLGFEDTSNFTKFFKKGTGMTPLDFRETD